MNTYRATASALIHAPAAQVYALLADYRDGHPHILPNPPFVSLEVEQGGLGAGTVVRFQMRAFGKTQTFRALIETPEPGRRLVETDLEVGTVTTFMVDPHADGQQAQVTITTEGKVRAGLLGALERFFTLRFLQRTYAEELKRLAALAEARVHA